MEIWAHKTSFVRNFLWKYLYQTRKVISHVCVCQWYRVWFFFRFIRFWNCSDSVVFVLFILLLQQWNDSHLQVWSFNIFIYLHVMSKIKEQRKKNVSNVIILFQKQKQFEDTKQVFRIRRSKKDRQHNGQNKTDKRTNNDLENIYIKLEIE